MSFVIKDVRIFTGEEVIESGSVLVEDGIIKHVGPDIRASDVTGISKPGHTLLPGLIDAHVHALSIVPLLEQALRFGITTLMDMHNVPAEVAKLKKVAGERKDVADLKSACYAATIDGGWPAWVVKKHATPEVSLYSTCLSSATQDGKC